MVQPSPETNRLDRRALKPIFKLAERAMTYPARITKVVALGPDLARVTLHASQLCEAEWQPGDKLDVEVAQLSYRAYTPCLIDPHMGLAEILVFDHGQSAGSRRLCAARAGETVRIRGPKTSTPLSGQAGAVSFFGDETSIGLLVAHKYQDPCFVGAGAWIEASSAQSIGAVLNQLDLAKATLLQRAPSASHLERAADQIFRGMTDDPCRSVVLTGQASSIQSVRKHLLARGIHKSRIITHAFWAEGKVALG